MATSLAMNLSTILSTGTAIVGISCALSVTPAEKGDDANWPPASAHVARISSQPPSRGKEAVTSAKGRALYRSEDGLFYVTARVNGVPVKFLIDTGATMVVLTPADAERIGIVPEAAAVTREMETAAGSSVVRALTLGEIDVAGRNVADVQAAIMQRGLSVSLLGQNLLSRLGTITLSGDEMHIS